MKKYLAVLLIIVLAIMTFTACGSKEPEEVEADETEVISEESPEGTVTSESVQSDDSFKVLGEFNSFEEVLKANEDRIRANSEWREKHNELPNNVLLHDLNGDNNPELMYIEGDEYGSGALHIYTMKDDKVVECEYDVYPKDPYIEDNNRAFVFLNAGGGCSYMLYSGKEPGVFYSAYRITGNSVLCRSIKYSVDDEGQVKAETSVENVYGLHPGTEERDEYEVDGNSVSPNEAVKVFKEHREDYNKLLMYDIGFQEDLEDTFKVFEKLKTDKPLAGSYDEVMEQLNE